MTLVQMEKRVKALEQTLQDLAATKRAVNRKWYRTHAGRFAGDAIFDRITRLGRAYRKSLRPAPDSKRS